VVYRAAAGVAIGYGVGYGLVRLSKQRVGPATTGLNVGLFALGTTLVAYAVAEVFNGYGFLAVFVAALERGGGEGFRSATHAFIDQIEALLVAASLIGVGVLISAGILSGLSVAGAVLVLVSIFVIRPVLGWVALIGSPIRGFERGAIAFLGIKGLGSLFYLAYATTHGEFSPAFLETAWAVVVFAIVVSVIVHGTTAPLMMRRIDRRESEKPDV